LTQTNEGTSDDLEVREVQQERSLRLRLDHLVEAEASTGGITGANATLNDENV